MSKIPRVNTPFSGVEYTSNAHVYTFDGLRSPRRWDPTRSSSENAGLYAPSSGPAISGVNISWLGQLLVGERVGYVRFVDRLGYVSNLSPVSNVLDLSGGTTISIKDVSNTSPIVVTTNGAHNLANGLLANITGVTGNTAANGVYQVQVLGSDQVALLGTTGNSSYRGEGTIGSGSWNFRYTNVPLPNDPKVVKRQLLRSKPGDLNVLYVDIETSDLISTAFTSPNLDDDLGRDVPMFDDKGRDLAVHHFDLPPAHKTIVTSHLSRLWAAGDRVYERGSVFVSYGTSKVYGMGTDFTAAMKGRTLWVDGSPYNYEITAVDEDAQTLDTNPPYSGTTDPYAGFSVAPAVAERNLVYFSAAGLPEAWPPENTIEIPFNPDAGQVTALIPYDSYLFVTTEFQTWRIIAGPDPTLDDTILPVIRRGCINQRCWITVDGLLLLMDGQGIYSGGSSAEPISGSIQDIFRFDHARELNPNWGINFKASQYFHAVHSPTEEVVRWFVVMEGQYTPRHAIVLHYRTMQLWFEEYPFSVGCSVLGTEGTGATLGTHPQVFLGTEGCKFLALGTGTLDLAPSDRGTVNGRVSSAGLDWLVDASAQFSTEVNSTWYSSLIGADVTITDGAGRGQSRRICFATTTDLRIVEPWRVIPDKTSRYQVGGIKWKVRTGWFRWMPGDPQGGGGDTNVKRCVETVIRPVANPASMGMTLYADRKLEPLIAQQTYALAFEDGIGATKGDSYLPMDPQYKNGQIRKRMEASHETEAPGQSFISVQIEGVTNVDQMMIHEINVEGAQ